MAVAVSLIVKCSSLLLICGIAVPASAATREEVAHACEAVHHSDAIFIGTPQPPVPMNVSFEDRIEPARQKWLKAQKEAEGSRDRDVQIRAIDAFAEYDHLRIQFPPPMDMVLIPVQIDTRFKGDVPDVVFMSPPGPYQFDPARRYLFFASFMMQMLDARFVRPAGLPMPAGDDAPAERVVRAAMTATRGGLIFGSIETESPSDPGGAMSPAAGVSVRVQAPGFTFDTTTDSQGIFMMTEVPSGPVTIEPALHERFTIINGSLSGSVEEGGCVPFTLGAALNGRIRGKVVGRDGKPSAGLPLQLLSLGDDYTRFFPFRDRLQTRANAKGEFEFRGLPPGEYLLGHNLYPESDVIIIENGIAPVTRPPTFYPGTSNRAAAVPIVVGEGTLRSGVDFALVW
jgi:hypothetical protein